MRVERPDWRAVLLVQRGAVALQQLPQRPRGAVYRREAANSGDIVPSCQGSCARSAFVASDVQATSGHR